MTVDNFSSFWVQILQFWKICSRKIHKQLGESKHSWSLLVNSLLLCRKDGSKRMMWKRFPAGHITGHNKFSSMKAWGSFWKVGLFGITKSSNRSKQARNLTNIPTLEPPLTTYFEVWLTSKLNQNELRSSILQRLRSVTFLESLWNFGAQHSSCQPVEYCWVWTRRPKVIGSIVRIIKPPNNITIS